MRKLIFTVTNDLAYDQRMMRICGSLAVNGYDVTLVGRNLPNAPPLVAAPYRQKRLSCLFEQGFLFYAEFNVRLLFYLLLKRCDVICAIDLDTILPVLFASWLRKKRRVYDAHELFCEMKEVATRPAVYKFWKRIERFAIPKFNYGYTVNSALAAEFHRMYGVEYEVIRNTPVLREDELPNDRGDNEKFILYQGSVNEGRSFETLIPAMRDVQARLLICGDGNFMKEARQIARDAGVEDKIQFEGKISPSQLPFYTKRATVGVTLFDNRGLSNYYSLANRFFDYMHACVPQLCVNYPVYREIVAQFPFALLIDDLSAENISRKLNLLLEDQQLYKRMQDECRRARKVFNWQIEERTLLAFYERVKND
jgi:glycosyltransferase involved in cell wall biosynthesis